jgi:hypothetical protein
LIRLPLPKHSECDMPDYRSSFPHHKISLYLLILAFWSCNTDNAKTTVRPYPDKPFVQEHSVKYALPLEESEPKKAFTDRNGAIKVLSSAGLLVPSGGRFLYPGRLIADRSYLHFADSELRDLQLWEGQFYYLDEQAVMSNAWAGSAFFPLANSQVKIFCLGSKSEFLAATERGVLFYQGDQLAWESDLNQQILEIHYHPEQASYYLLTTGALYRFSPPSLRLETLVEQGAFVSMAIAGNNILLPKKEDTPFFKPMRSNPTRIGSRTFPAYPLVWQRPLKAIFGSLRKTAPLCCGRMEPTTITTVSVG